MTKVKQVLYIPKPRKEKLQVIKPITIPFPKQQITGQDVLDYLGNKIWDQRVFLLVTVLIVENVFLLVRMR